MKKYMYSVFMLFFVLILILMYRLNCKYEAMLQQAHDMDNEYAIRRQSYLQLTELHSKLKEGTLSIDQTLKQIEELRKLNEQRAGTVRTGEIVVRP